jgi:hypothetical protein
VDDSIIEGKMMEHSVEQIETRADKINALIARMDLPINRRDASRQETVRWLVHNLGVRNNAHAKYKAAMLLLIEEAKTFHLLKAKEIKQLEDTL